MSCLVDRSGTAPFRVTTQAFVSCDFIGGCLAALRFDLEPGPEQLDLGRVNTEASKLGWHVQIRWEDGEPYRRDRCPLHIHNAVAASPSKDEATAAPAAAVAAVAAVAEGAIGPVVGRTDRHDSGLKLIAAERTHQILDLGHTRGSDLGYTGDREQDLIKAAAYYLAHGGVRSIAPSAFRDDLSGTYPWGDDTRQVIDRDPIVNLTKAGALIAAEIDRQQAAR